MTKMDEEPEFCHRRRSKIVLHIHAVWAVGRRADFIKPQWERIVYRCITQQVEAQKCEVFAIGGMPDHVHLVARLHGSVSASAFMKQVKGHSSRFINAHRAEFTELFHWQDGFALFAVSQDSVPDAIQYVHNQKHHHADGTTLPDWEETDEPAP